MDFKNDVKKSVNWLKTWLVDSLPSIFDQTLINVQERGKITYLPL